MTDRKTDQCPKDKETGIHKTGKWKDKKMTDSNTE